MSVAGMEARLPRMLADLERLVRCESPSSDLAALARSADVVAETGTALLGREPERIEVDGRPHLRWGDPTTEVLLLAHHDTVWPIGSLAEHPFDIDDGVLRGPGCLDMKAGLVMAWHALDALQLPAGVVLLVTADEEIGSPSSRELIEAEAADARAVLVLEAAADDGSLKVQRKGMSAYEVRVHGRAAHAGLEPTAGVNATVELARQILTVSELQRLDAGTTVTPTVAAAGSTRNTVPAFAAVDVDVRCRTAAEQHDIDIAMRALRPYDPLARIEVRGGPNRLPLEAHASADLFALAQRVAADLGLAPPTGAAVGGGSDGNLTAALGVPTLDGLGAVGGGAHAAHEHVRVAEIPPRTALLTAMIAELIASSGGTGSAGSNRTAAR